MCTLSVASHCPAPARTCQLRGYNQRSHHLPACLTVCFSATPVLQDVVSAMFTPEFIEELFKPQELYSAKSARQIFDKLAHSSIMRLSVSSMNKLYDLMTMGFKYQLVACNHCGELLEVTLNHLMSVMQMVDSGPAQESVRRATELVTHRYAGMSGTDFCLLRQTLCTHLQDKRIKVSLFLQDGIQRPDGAFCWFVGCPVDFGCCGWHCWRKKVEGRGKR
eukprot:COSAG01_NODE_356_length_18316_cov_24.401493_9_plen_220_part_00